MTRDELLQKIGDHDDDFIERKLDDVSPAELRQTVCVFAKSVPEGREAVFVHDDPESPSAWAQTYDELILSRAEKARELLQRTGKVFKVLGVGYRLGSHQPLPDSGYEESRVCRVIGCTSHHVTLEDTSSTYRFTEPLANVTIGLEHKQIVPLLVVAPNHRA